MRPFLTGFFIVICVLFAATHCFADKAAEKGLIVENNPVAKAYGHFLLGKMFEAEGSYDSAYDEYLKAKSLDPNYGSELDYRIGITLFYMNKHKEAEHVLMDLIEKDRSNDLAYLLLMAMMGTEEGRSDDINRIYRKMLLYKMSIKPEDAEYPFQIAYSYMKEGRMEDAKQYFEKASELNGPFSAKALYFLAVIYERQGQRKMAIESLEHALDLIQSPDIINYLAYLYAKEGIKLQKAKSLAEKAVSLKPDEPAFADTLGWIYYKLGDLDNALKYLLQAGVKEDPEVYYHLGKVYYEKGDYAKAKSYLELALDWANSDDYRIREDILAILDKIRE